MKPQKLDLTNAKVAGLLRDLSSSEAAAKLGVAGTTVLRARHKLGIVTHHRPGRKQTPIPEKARKQLGRIPDPAIARAFGIPLHIVEIHRAKLGIAAAPRYAYLPPSVVRRLGQTADRALAKEAGVSLDTIKHRRKVLGIAQPPRRPPGRRPIELSPHVVSQLGRVPDERLAEKAGVSTNTITNARYRAGISASHGIIGGKPRIPVPKAVIKLLGKKTDAELALRAGVNVKVIRARRTELQIPPHCVGRPAASRTERANQV